MHLQPDVVIMSTHHHLTFFQKIRILWAVFLYTLDTSIQSTYRGIMGTSNRRWIDQLLNTWVRRMLKLLQIHCTVHNPKKIKPLAKRATIIMCNHSSLLDIPISLTAFPDYSVRMLAKKEMMKIPLMNRGMKAGEFPFIDRKNRQQAIRDLAHVRKLLESGIVMWIAPEGTRSRTQRVGPFKKGAFITAIQTDAVIIPMAVRGANNILPPHTLDLKLGQSAEVHVGDIVDTRQYTMDTKDQLIADVRRVIQALAGETSDII